MKLFGLVLIVLGTNAIVIDKKETPMAGPFIIQDPRLDNTKNDDAYLTKVFEKYSTKEGEDGESDRYISKANAKFVAREVVGRWSGKSGAELDAAVDARFDSSWHNIDTENKDKISVKNAQYWVRQVAGDDRATGFKGYKFWINRIIYLR